MESDHDLLLPLVSEENVCLPLAINAVSRYWDVDLPMAEAAEIARRYPAVDGSILIEGVELAERHGLACPILHSSLAELKRVIDCGIPPVVILPGVHNTIQHASVISGYNNEDGTVMHYIPQADSKGEYQVGVIPEKRFDEMWSEDGRLAILVAPPQTITDLALPDEGLLRSNRLCFESERQNLLRRPEDAVGSLREAIELDGSNSTAHALLAGILNGQNSQECVGHYKRSISLNGRSYLAYRGLGNYYLKTKQHAKAEECYTKAISINATRYGPTYKNRGIVRLEQGDADGARKDLKAYLKQTPGAPDAASIRAALREM